MIENKHSADILALTEKLYGLAKDRIANGQDVTQENVAILNRARTALAKSKHPGTPHSTQPRSIK